GRFSRSTTPSLLRTQSVSSLLPNWSDTTHVSNAPSGTSIFSWPTVRSAIDTTPLSCRSIAVICAVAAQFGPNEDAAISPSIRYRVPSAPGVLFIATATCPLSPSNTVRMLSDAKCDTVWPSGTCSIRYSGLKSARATYNDSAYVTVCICRESTTSQARVPPYVVSVRLRVRKPIRCGVPSPVRSEMTYIHFIGLSRATTAGAASGGASPARDDCADAGTAADPSTMTADTSTFTLMASLPAWTSPFSYSRPADAIQVLEAHEDVARLRAVRRAQNAGLVQLVDDPRRAAVAHLEPPLQQRRRA